MKNLVIYHHLGIGDSIACNGLVRHILKKNNKKILIYLICKDIFFKTIRFMYRDEKNIIPMEILTIVFA